MRIDRVEVSRITNEAPRLKKETWLFWFDISMVRGARLALDHYEIGYRSPGQRKWRRDSHWSRTSQRDVTFKGTPPLPSDVVAEAKQIIASTVLALEVAI